MCVQEQSLEKNGFEFSVRQCDAINQAFPWGGNNKKKTKSGSTQQISSV